MPHSNKSDLEEGLSAFRVVSVSSPVLQQLHEEHLAGVEGDVLLMDVVGGGHP